MIRLSLPCGVTFIEVGEHLTSKSRGRGLHAYQGSQKVLVAVKGEVSHASICNLALVLHSRDYCVIAYNAAGKSQLAGDRLHRFFMHLLPRDFKVPCVLAIQARYRHLERAANVLKLAASWHVPRRGLGLPGRQVALALEPCLGAIRLTTSCKYETL